MNEIVGMLAVVIAMAFIFGLAVLDHAAGGARTMPEPTTAPPPPPPMPRQYAVTQVYAREDVEDGLVTPRPDDIVL